MSPPKGHPCEDREDEGQQPNNNVNIARMKGNDQMHTSTMVVVSQTITSEDLPESNH